MVKIIRAFKFHLGLSAVLVFAGLSGCSDKPKESAEQAKPGAEFELSFEFLNSAIVLGSSRSEIIARFGEPRSQSVSDRGVLDYYDMEPGGLESWRNKLTGFQVLYKDDKVIRWAPVYSSRSVTPAPRSPDDSVLKMVLVSNPRDYESIVKASESGLTIRTIKSVSLVRNTAGEQIVRFELCDEDRVKLQEMTRTAVGKYLVITAGGEPVEALRILSPLEGSGMDIQSFRQDKIAALESWLRKLVQPCP